MNERRGAVKRTWWLTQLQVPKETVAAHALLLYRGSRIKMATYPLKASPNHSKQPHFLFSLTTLWQPLCAELFLFFNCKQNNTFGYKQMQSSWARASYLSKFLVQFLLQLDLFVLLSFYLAVWCIDKTLFTLTCYNFIVSYADIIRSYSTRCIFSRKYWFKISFFIVYSVFAAITFCFSLGYLIFFVYQCCLYK